MEEKFRNMWADLYRFFERCSKEELKDKNCDLIGKEAGEILKRYNGDDFVREVLSVTIGYWRSRN